MKKDQSSLIERHPLAVMQPERWVLTVTGRFGKMWERWMPDVPCEVCNRMFLKTLARDELCRECSK
jgi:hypothetical protein